MKKLAIIGGGAAGLIAALAAAKALQAQKKPADVVIYEADDRVGRSILATGNGRCNFSNARCDAGVYHNAAFVAAAFDELVRQKGSGKGHVGGCSSPSEVTSPIYPEGEQEAGRQGSEVNPVHSFFAHQGLMWREESEGRLYPLANKASSVRDVLRASLCAMNVREVCEHKVLHIEVPPVKGGLFRLRFANGSVEQVQAVIVAVGGRIAHSLLPAETSFCCTRPVLGPLSTDTSAIKQLNNVRIRCAVTLVDDVGLFKAREVGEVLFREYGVSGIAVFNLSRHAQAGNRLLINMLPHLSEEEIGKFLHIRLFRMTGDGSLTAEGFLRGMLLPLVAKMVLKEAGLFPEKRLSEGDLFRLERALKSFPLLVRGVGDARQCQVQRGGAKVESFDARSMEMRGIPGLYVVGEALDVDGPCGGYNLHWAWTSGLLAGRAAAERLNEGD